MFVTMSLTLTNKPLGKLFGVIRRGTKKSDSGDRMWQYETVIKFWPDSDPDINSSDDESL